MWGPPVVMDQDLQQPDLDSATTRELVRRITECQLSLYSFIASLVSNHNDAEDIRQETNLVLWRKASEYSGVEHFHAWARRIAYFEVLKHRRRKGRASIPLEPDVLEQVAQLAVDKADLLDERRGALRHCVASLSETDRHLLCCRYRDGLTLEAASGLLGRSASSVRHSMSRIRRRLRQCVDRRLAAGEHP